MASLSLPVLVSVLLCARAQRLWLQVRTRHYRLMSKLWEHVTNASKNSLDTETWLDGQCSQVWSLAEKEREGLITTKQKRCCWSLTDRISNVNIDLILGRWKSQVNENGLLKPIFLMRFFYLWLPRIQLWSINLFRGVFLCADLRLKGPDGREEEKDGGPIPVIWLPSIWRKASSHTNSLQGEISDGSQGFSKGK